MQNFKIKIRYVGIVIALIYYTIVLKRSDYTPDTYAEKNITVIIITIIIVAFGLVLEWIVESLRKFKK